jgi:hypothetical protein
MMFSSIADHLQKEMIMWLQEVYQRLVNQPRTRRQTWPQTGRRHRARLGAEQLEDRLVLSNFTAAAVSDLSADIYKHPLLMDGYAKHSP